MNKVIGLVLLAVGVALLIFGYNASQTVGEQVVEGLTGRFTDRTTWFILGGIGAMVGGAALLLRGDRRAMD